MVLAYELPGSKASLINFINFITENGINSPAVTHLRFRVWFEGYQQNKIKTPIYGDVPNQVRKWFAEGVKFYVFSNTWVDAQRALLKNTNHGDLTNLISGHYDNDFGLLTEAESWRRLCSELRELPSNVLFLTKSPVEGRAAADAGLAVVLVLTHRHNVKAISHEDRARFPVVRTLNDLIWSEGSMMPTSSVQPAASQTVQPGFEQLTTSQPASSGVPTAISASEASKPIISGSTNVTSSSAAPSGSGMSSRSSHSRSQRQSSATGAASSATSKAAASSATGRAAASSATSGQKSSTATAAAPNSSGSSRK